MKLAVLLSIVAASLQAQADGTITGTVSDSVNHLPVYGVLVTAENGSRDLTARDGSFTIHDVPAGDVKLRVRLGGYRPLETTKRIAASELLRCDFELHPLAGISGKVVDKDTGAVVPRPLLLTSHGRVEKVSRPAAGNKGFEFTALDAGDYTIEIDPSDEAAISYGDSKSNTPRTVYGNARFPAPIHLPEGEQRVIEMPVSAQAAYSASGTIEFPPGVEEEQLSIGYTSETGRSSSRGMGLRRAGPFRVEGLVPGTYGIFADLGEGFGHSHGYAFAGITDHDVEGLKIRITSGVTVSGTIKVKEDGVMFPSGASELVAVLLPAERLEGRMPQPMSVVSGAFHGERVAEGKYWPELIALPDGFAVARVLFGNKDIRDQPVTLNGPGELTFIVTSRPGTVIGSVPTRGAIIELRPAHGSPFQRGTTSGENGEFFFRNVGPGTYKIEGAAPFEVREGEIVTVAVSGQ